MLKFSSSSRGMRGKVCCVRGWGGDGDKCCGDGRGWGQFEEKSAGTGGDEVSVDFAGREWGHILVLVQLSNSYPGPLHFNLFMSDIIGHSHRLKTMHCMQY